MYLRNMNFLKTMKSKGQKIVKSQELNELHKETDKIVKKINAKQDEANTRRAAAEEARRAKFRVSENR